MNQQGEIVNRVANSPLVTIDLEDYYHHGERVVLDVKDWLFQELILKEKEFREFVKNHDWDQYLDKNVAIICSVDAIVPTWAYMLIATKLEPHAHLFCFGDLIELNNQLYKEALSKIDINKFSDKKIVIKGCGNLPVPEFAYVELTRILLPVVSSIMYGEPCSTVPLYKKSKS